ncbi:MAG: hypothetical protein ABIA62_00895 [Candidatus Woesearchaeota archaeon]
MERVLLEMSIGTLIAGGALLTYVRNVKKRLRSRILRNYIDKG